MTIQYKIENWSLELVYINTRQKSWSKTEQFNN